MLGIGPHETLILSRLAALQGHAVSQLEFEQLWNDLDQHTLSGIPLTSKIVILWRARFPDSGMRVPAWPPKPGDTPALWLAPPNPDGTASLLITIGTLPDGALSYLDQQGSARLLPPEQSCLGRLLILDPSPSADEPSRTDASYRLTQSETTPFATLLRQLRNWIARLA